MAAKKKLEHLLNAVSFLNPFVQLCKSELQFLNSVHNTRCHSVITASHINRKVDPEYHLSVHQINPLKHNSVSVTSKL